MERLKEIRRRIRVVFSVNNIEYLIKGGRISKTKGYIADMLDIKPILHFDQDGFIQPYGKVRGHRASRSRLLEIMEREGDAQPGRR